METRRTSTSVWVITAALFLLSYPLSFGPGCWLTDRKYLDPTTLDTVYSPIFRLAMNGPRALGHTIMWYADLGMKHRSIVVRNRDYYLIIWNDGAHEIHVVPRFSKEDED